MLPLSQVHVLCVYACVCIWVCVCVCCVYNIFIWILRHFQRSTKTNWRTLRNCSCEQRLQLRWLPIIVLSFGSQLELWLIRPSSAPRLQTSSEMSSFWISVTSIGSIEFRNVSIVFISHLFDSFSLWLIFFFLWPTNYEPDVDHSPWVRRLMLMCVWGCVCVGKMSTS